MQTHPDPETAAAATVAIAAISNALSAATLGTQPRVGGKKFLNVAERVQDLLLLGNKRIIPGCLMYTRTGCTSATLRNF